MMGGRFAAIAALALLPAVAARAQSSTAAAISASSRTSQATSGATVASSLSQTEKQDIGDIHPAASAGILSYFHGQATFNTQYVSNAPLYHSRDEADVLFAPAFEEGFTAPLNKYWKVNADVRLEDFTYASHQTLGFWGVSGDADIEYQYKPTYPRFYAGTEPYYYLSYANGDRLTSAIGPVGGVDESISINRGKTLLLLADHFGQYFASPGPDTRATNSVTVALTQQIKPDLYAQLYYQYQYSKYTVFDRDENRSVVGLSLIHQITPVTFLSVFVNYADNASNNSLAKYTTIDSGLSLVYQY